MQGYYYDGNGSMVKSVIGDVVTYYPGSGFQEKTDGTHTNTRKYYAFGSSTVAMRENGVLTWLMNDQVNSTTVTAAENGTPGSEIRYTAFGGATCGGDTLGQRGNGNGPALHRSTRGPLFKMAS